jgi:hypothetical protein
MPGVTSCVRFPRGSSPRTAPKRDVELNDNEEEQISVSALLAGLRDAGMNREDAREVRAFPCTLLVQYPLAHAHARTHTHMHTCLRAHTHTSGCVYEHVHVM